MRSKFFVLLAAAVGTLAAGSSVKASVFSDVTLGAAGPSGLNLAVFQTGPTVMQASNSGTLFSGNVGLAAGGSTNFSGGGTITGTLYVDPAASTQSNLGTQMHVSGGIVTQSLTQAVSDVKNANVVAAGLTADQTIASLGGSAATLTAIGAVNAAGGHNTVYDVGSINITNSKNNLTIAGGANDFFIINVGGNVTVSNGAILVSGGIPLSHVLFNLTGTNSSVNLTNGTSVLDGTYLAPNAGQSINLTPGTVNGTVIGYMIHTSSGPNIQGQGFTPEPASLGVLGLGVVVMMARRRRR